MHGFTADKIVVIDCPSFCAARDDLKLGLMAALRVQEVELLWSLKQAKRMAREDVDVELESADHCMCLRQQPCETLQ